MAKSGAGFVLNDEFDQDIYIAPRNTLNALHGDKVEVKLLKRGGRPEGEVVKVIERAREEFVCNLEMSEKFAFAIPDNRRLEIDFFIPLKYVGKARDGDKVLVKLRDFKEGEKNPVGEVIQVIGKPGDHQVEMHAILLEHGLPVEFPEHVLKAADKIPDEIDQIEVDTRRDFRDTLTFTIDPWDAKDFDDAISFEKIDDGLYEIGVHIADVSHYVKPGDVLDKEAQNRATSVYLVDRVVPMLPERLSNQLCSLRPNEDKLCFSAVFQITDKGVVKSRWFGRTIIHSKRRFSYEEAQERIESGIGDLADELGIADRIAKQLRTKRFQKGAISFDREEMRFKLDEAGKPIEIVMKVSLDAHKLIEEFMLLANREVAENYAKKLKTKKKAPFVYRVHDNPNEEKLLNLQNFAARFGYGIDLSDPSKASSEINKLLAESKGQPEYNLLSTLAIRTMAKAKYTTHNKGHYGLAFKHYTHFTSPIRRYPDVLVHRLLADYLQSEVRVDGDALEDLCAHSSAQEIEAEEAERDSTKYKQVEYMSDFVGDEFEGVVSGVTDHTLFVELNNKCEGGIRLSNMLDDFYFFDEENYQVIGQNKRRRYRLGDPVRVRVMSCNLAKRIIELDLLGKPGKPVDHDRSHDGNKPKGKGNRRRKK